MSIHFFVVVLERLGGIILRKNATVGIVIFNSVSVTAICDSISLLFGKILQTTCFNHTIIFFKLTD